MDNETKNGKYIPNVKVSALPNGLIKLDLFIKETELTYELIDNLIYLKLKYPLFSHLTTVEDITTKINEKLVMQSYKLKCFDNYAELNIDYHIDEEVFSDQLLFYSVKNDKLIKSKIKKNELLIRKAIPEDVPKICELIIKLAEFEDMKKDVYITKETLENQLFCLNPKIYCMVILLNEVLVGYLIYHYNFSIFAGNEGIWLENLFIEERYRKFGLGKKLFAELCKQALEQKIFRISWWALYTNEPGFQFYKKIGSVPLDHWRVFRISNQSLYNLAKF